MVDRRSVGLSCDLPDEARQLTRDSDSDSDGGALLRARCIEVRPAAMQAQLSAPGCVDRGRRLAGLAALERLGDRQMSSTPKSSRRSSMNALTSVGSGRAPWRQTRTRP
jgi:hypothetical protein